MWEDGYHCKKYKGRTPMEKLNSVKGHLSVEDAQKWFAKFCEYNPTFAVKILMDVTLYPVQDLLIRSFFMRDFSLMVAGRGFSKTYTVSMFVVLYAIFRPKSKIIICSGTFRQSKMMFKQVEDFIQSGKFLKQCVTSQATHSTDCHEVSINGSRISALPLTEKIRGMRANLVIVDELILVPTEIENSVIKPFLNVRYKSTEQDKIKKAEDELISQGKLRECDRTPMINNKLIGLSSASYKIESLYKDRYEPYVNAIMNKDAEGVNHFVARLSYRAAPENLLEIAQIEDAKRNSSTQQFQKEYEALFISEGGGFYKMKNILDATVPYGEFPRSRIIGNISKKYILSIDANYNDAETSDDFAMCVIELDDTGERGYLVHAYALPKSDTLKRSEYLAYLLKAFNIVYVIIDSMGGLRFIEDAKLFVGEVNVPLYLFEAEFLDGPEGIAQAVQTYSKGAGRIVHSQVFRKSGWKQLANEKLQGNLERKKIMFASPLSTDEAITEIESANIPSGLEFKREVFFKEKDKGATESNYKNQSYNMDLAENVDQMIELTKIQLSHIEVSISTDGLQQFDLPKNLKSSKSPNRMRKDLYMVLLMASWAMECYYTICKGEVVTEEYFRPVRIAY